MGNMQNLKVQCPNCKKTRHETTEHYKPDITPKGNFVRLIDPWKSWKWNCYDDEGEALSTTPCALMTCPGCSAPLAPKGRLTVIPPDEEFICEVCGKRFNARIALVGHMRSHKRDGE